MATVAQLRAQGLAGSPARGGWEWLEVGERTNRLS